MKPETLKSTNLSWWGMWYDQLWVADAENSWGVVREYRTSKYWVYNAAPPPASYYGPFDTAEAAYAYKVLTQ
jgi:hypothetical protein